MVQILSREPVAVPSAGEYRRYTKLREPFDVLADEFMVPLTDRRDASDITFGATMLLSRSARC